MQELEAAKQTCTSMILGQFFILTDHMNPFLQTDFTKKVNVKNKRRFDRPTVIFKFMIKSKISMCLYTIVRGLMRY